MSSMTPVVQKVYVTVRRSSALPLANSSSSVPDATPGS
jgi:hypothetical protein